MVKLAQEVDVYIVKNQVECLIDLNVDYDLIQETDNLKFVFNNDLVEENLEKRTIFSFSSNKQKEIIEIIISNPELNSLEMYSLVQDLFF